MYTVAPHPDKQSLHTFRPHISISPFGDIHIYIFSQRPSLTLYSVEQNNRFYENTSSVYS
jgi:hypothetical protein